MRKASKIGISKFDSFFFISDGTDQHERYNYKTPYYYNQKKDVFNLKNPCQRFWKIYKIFLQVFADEGVEFIPIVYMGFGYNLLPFRNNLQGLDAYQIWDPENIEYQAWVFEKICITAKEVWGKNYKPRVKINSEFMHAWSGEQWHNIAEWSRVMVRLLLKYTLNWRIIADRSHSDAILIDISQRHDCVKPATCPYPDLMHGSDDFDSSKKSMWVSQEDHALGIAQDVIDNNAWPISRAWGCIYHGDGATNGDGFCLYLPHGRIVCQGTPNQMYEYGMYVWPRAFAEGKKITIAPMCLETYRDKNGNVPYPLIPNYTVDNFFWGRFRMLAKSHDEVYGR